MEPKELLSILSVAERLKCNTRHSYTSSGRQESVAEHSWRMALMAMLLKEEYPDADMSKVIEMSLIHDLGEAFTGDIPTFEKSEQDGEVEEQLYQEWVEQFSSPTREHWLDLLQEMNRMETEEAKIYKALDKLEAVIQHNEADISTWLPLEYDLQLTYGAEQVKFSPYMQKLKLAVDQWTENKIKENRERQ